MRFPTLSDVARHAGVSYATADRVVNQRGGVSEKSAARVRRAISDLGYVRNVAAANLSQQRIYRFAVILPVGEESIFGKMATILRQERERVSADRIDLVVEEVPVFDPAALTDCLGKLGREGIDAVTLVGTDDPKVLAAMSALRATGVTVVTLVADMPPGTRDAYIGIDNAAAGRTAARLIGLAHGGRPGRVLPVVGAMTARDHADRLRGLREVMAADFPQIQVLYQIEGRDRQDLVDKRVSAALGAERDITAIYNLGAGNPGLIRILQDWPRATPRPFVVMHELMDHARAALEAGLIDVVIDQRPEEEIARAFEIMRRGADRHPPERYAPIGAAIYVKDNLPPETAGTSTGDD